MSWMRNLYYSQVLFETYFYLFRGDRRFEKPGRKDVGKAFQLFEVFFICTSMVFVLTEAHRQYLY